MRKLKKGWSNFLIIVNIVIIMTLTNNSFLTDFILLLIFIINSRILLKYGRL